VPRPWIGPNSPPPQLPSASALRWRPPRSLRPPCDAFPVRHRSQVLPAGERGYRHVLGSGVAETVDVLSLAAGKRFLGAVEPSAGERLAVRKLPDGLEVQLPGGGRQDALCSLRPGRSAGDGLPEEGAQLLLPETIPQPAEAQRPVSSFPRGRFHGPIHFCDPGGCLLPRPLFSFPGVHFLDGRFFGVPHPRLSSRTGILASWTPVFRSGASSFFRNRHLGDRGHRVPVRAAIPLRSTHSSPGDLIRACEARRLSSTSRCASKHPGGCFPGTGILASTSCFRRPDVSSPSNSTLPDQPRRGIRN